MSKEDYLINFLDKFDHNSDGIIWNFSNDINFDENLSALNYLTDLNIKKEDLSTTECNLIFFKNFEKNALAFIFYDESHLFKKEAFIKENCHAFNFIGMNLNSSIHEINNLFNKSSVKFFNTP